MTRAATAFVAPLTFQALSGNPVQLDLLDPATESIMGHIESARWADLILIAPATADFIARMRLGLAGDLLSALCLASQVPIALAPAMNRAMWEHAATQEHISVLGARGVWLLGPASGSQACGEVGPGRMLEPDEICFEVSRLLAGGCLRACRVLISAGPTREPLDPVRFISNRSSGKMGYALAEAARRAGAHVTLVSGPTNLPEPKVAAFVSVETAEDMFRSVIERAPRSQIYIGAAAIADYRPAVVETGKIKKQPEELKLTLIRTRDVLTAVAGCEPRPFIVGFAAETHDLEENARRKLTEKGADMVAANWVAGQEGGFDSDDNALTIYWPEGQEELPLAPKSRIAEQLIDLIADRYHVQNPDQDPR